MKARLSALAMAAALISSSNLVRADVLWNAASGDWGNAANWTPNQVPNIQGHSGPADVVTVSSGAVTYSGSDGDWRNNTTVTVTGAGTTWTQSSGNWLKIADGSGTTGVLNVNAGAVFDAHNAGVTFVGNGGTGTLNLNGGSYIGAQVQVAVGSAIAISNGGSLSTNTQFLLNAGSAITANTGAQLSINGDMPIYGFLSIAGVGTVVNLHNHEFQPKGGAGMSVSMSGGELDANVVSFNGSTTSMDFSGGTINVTNNQNGIWAGPGGYLNFTPGSTGVFHVTNELASHATADLLNNGKIKLDNAVNPGAFTVVPDLAGTGVLISLPAAIPEPASLSLLAIGAAGLLGRRRRA